MFPSPSRSCGLTVSFLLSLSILVSVMSEARADDRRITPAEVPQARVDPRPIKLPVIDGNDIRFKHLSTAEGLSQTRVANIVQDDQGFMWFGTQYGLNRYDGYNFKVFVHEPGNPNSLSGVFIGALFKDRQGRLWIGCGQFLNRFEPATETFTQYPVQLVNHPSQIAYQFQMARCDGLRDCILEKQEQRLQRPTRERDR